MTENNEHDVSQSSVMMFEFTVRNRCRFVSMNTTVSDVLFSESISVNQRMNSSYELWILCSFYFYFMRKSNLIPSSVDFMLSVTDWQTVFLCSYLNISRNSLYILWETKAKLCSEPYYCYFTVSSSEELCWGYLIKLWMINKMSVCWFNVQ